jgi:hypothetical protein
MGDLDEEAAEQTILRLTKHLGRKPTGEEVMYFLFATPEKREEFYNKKGI